MAGKPKAYRRVRRNASGILVVFFIDDAGNEIDPSKIGNYDMMSSDSTNLNETVAAPVQTYTGGGTDQSNNYSGSGSSDTSGSSDWESHFGTPLSKGNLGDLLKSGGDLLKGGPFGVVNALLESFGFGNDDPVLDNTKVAGTQLAKAVPVVGELTNADPSSFMDDPATANAVKNEAQVAYILTQSGIDPIAAQGLLQLARNTSGLDPMFNQDGAVGLLGWSGAQADQLVQFAVETKGNPIDTKTQTLFAVEQSKPNSKFMNPGAVEAYQIFVNNPAMTSEEFSRVYSEKALGVVVPDTQQDLAPVAADATPIGGWAPSFKPSATTPLSTPNLALGPNSGDPIATDPNPFGPVVTSAVTGEESLPDNTATFGVSPALPEVNVDGTIKPFAPNPISPLTTAPVVTSGITTTPQPKSSNTLPTVYEPQPGDVHLKDLIEQRDNAAIKTAGTDLVRKDGTTVPAVINDATSGPPVGWTPDNSTTKAVPKPRVDIPIDAKGLPAPSLDLDLARNPVDYTPSNIYKPIALGGFETNLGLGQSWVPQPSPIKSRTSQPTGMMLPNTTFIDSNTITTMPDNNMVSAGPFAPSISKPSLVPAGFDDIEAVNASPPNAFMGTPRSTPTPVTGKKAATMAPTNKASIDNSGGSNTSSSSSSSSSPTPEVKKKTPSDAKAKSDPTGNGFMTAKPVTVQTKTTPTKTPDTTKVEPKTKTESKKTDKNK